MEIYIKKENRLIGMGAEALLDSSQAGDIVWIDMLAPQEEERKVVENFLAVKIPTHEEMQEIESSSRLYKEDEALIMTINVLKNEEGQFTTVNVTFLLKKNIVVTIRYDDIVPFKLFVKLVSAQPNFALDNAVSVLLGILESIIEKTADALENISATIDVLSQNTFNQETRKNSELSKIFITTGLQGETNSRTRDSLSSITRMVVYLKFNINKEEESRFTNRLETLTLDATDLKDHSAFLGHKISFILDACLGLISIEQNNIIKIFSIAAVVLLPPTLIASIYGMNFRFIPELSWSFGYPLAIFFMIISAVLPYLYFKKKGWL